MSNLIQLPVIAGVEITTDRMITERLKEALHLVDVRALDHFIVGGADAYSFAENGLM